MSNQRPPWNAQQGSPVKPTPRRSSTLSLVVAILLSVLAALQWVLLGATQHPSIYAVIVPFAETFAAGASWLTFVLVRRAARTPPRG